MYKCSLDELPLNKDGIIIELKSESTLRRRMLDLGLIKNTIITPIFTSPFGNPRAYKVRGVTLAIRKSDAKKIEVSYSP